jgi:RNA polymerase sigma-70 factor (ECF subfamily)
MQSRWETERDLQAAREGDRSFFQWVAGISRHVVGDLARSHGAARLGGIDREEHLSPSGLESPEVSPSRAFRREERLDRLEEALERLSPDHREVIMLSHLEGLTTREVAERMGRSRPAAAMLLLRALKELKVVFGSTDSLHLPDRPLRMPGEADRASRE